MTTVSIRADGPTFREGEMTKILQVAVEVSGLKKRDKEIRNPDVSKCKRCNAGRKADRTR